jgi:DNA repair protein RadC
MDSGHFVPGGGMPGVRGRRDRPLEREEEEALFRLAFPGDASPMRRVARGEGARDPGREIRWEAALELARRALSAPVARPVPFRCAAEVFERYRYRLASSPVEVFLAVLLDVKHRPVREERVSVGVLDGSLIHPREVFAAAVRERAAAVILLHNHPSGDPAPSPEDREVTRRLRSAGGILGIPVLDHVIVGDGSFFSFREEAGW